MRISTELMLEALLVISVAALFYMELHCLRIKLENYVDKRIELMMIVYKLKDEQKKYAKDLAEFTKENYKEDETESEAKTKKTRTKKS